MTPRHESASLGGMSLGDSHHEDLAAALGARRELGAEYDRALAESFVDRVSKQIDAHVDSRVSEIAASQRRLPRPRGGGSLGFMSLIFGIPITAIAGASGHVAGLAIAWAGIAAVNFAAALRRGSPRSGPFG